MNGSEPPSSSATFLRLRPATSATAAPARSEPVTETPCTADVGDDGRRLLVGGVDVGVRTLREAGIPVDLLDRGRRLGALRGVLEQDRVADHEVRRREARDLVVREVPRHDPEQHPDRRAADDRRALAEDVDRLVAGDLLGVVGVVLGDVRGEVDLAVGGRERLAHLAHDDRGELVAPLAVQLGDAADERGPLGHRNVAPRAVGGIRRLDHGLERVVGDRRVGREGLARGGVDDGVVGHVHSDWLEDCVIVRVAVDAGRRPGEVSGGSPR